MKKQSGPKILLIDLETAPNLVWCWEMWKEWNSTEMQKSEWYILCWCAKWLHSKEVMSDALISHPAEYKKNPENDRRILESIWKLLDEADIVVGHNVTAFDIKKINARFISNGMLPPSPYKIVDTCLVARKHFGFTSNKLADLGKYLKEGKKLPTGGFSLWKECMLGLKQSWRKMIAYCKQDVVLLEKVYLRLLPYMDNHPNYAIYLKDEIAMCPNCGSKNLQKYGFVYNNTAKYQRFVCTDCGSWMRERKNLIPKSKIKLASR